MVFRPAGGGSSRVPNYPKGQKKRADEKAVRSSFFTLQNQSFFFFFHRIKPVPPTTKRTNGTIQ